ncbi:type II toxin-antitoxin system PemK/MazF family toxin [Candidatus Peregrinibacteria bacterium]|nr:type II toxin-antitoxin system PemK/MazF family toxin [Candidatus Peregrinibacteria bacterium]
MNIKYGDIVVADFAPQIGAEITKKRPALVVSRNEINVKGPLCILIPITGNVQKMLPFHIFVKASEKNGLLCNSKAVPEQIKSFDKRRILKKIGRLEQKYLQEIQNSTAFVLNQEIAHT